MWFSKFGGLALICVLALSGPSMAQARALPPYQYFDWKEPEPVSLSVMVRFSPSALSGHLQPRQHR